MTERERGMDIVRFKGGLGNQMFQYAFIEALRSRGRCVMASIGGYAKNPKAREFSICNVFTNINLGFVSDAIFDEIDEKWKKIKQDEVEKQLFCNNYEERFFWVEDVVKEPGVYHPNVFSTKNCTFVGYWQSEKYFKDVRKLLLTKFTFTKIVPDLEKFADMLENNGYVSVHIRRGDYLSNQDVYMGVCTREYYLKAIEYIENKNHNTKLIFFSDDMVWVKENLKVPNALYFDKGRFTNYADWYDMYLMSRCRHNIIANSTFSWWGAWLNQNENKIVVAPRRWHKNNTTPDIWCEEWVRL